MNKKQLVLQEIQKIANERAIVHRAQCHADALIYATGVSACSRELVSWLGHVGLRNNREAIAFWISAQLRDESIHEDENEIAVLLRRFKSRMREIELENT